MTRLFFIILFVGFYQNVNSQIRKPILKEVDDSRNVSDTTQVSTTNTSNVGLKDEKATIDLYKIISHERDTTFLDTTLSIKKEYKYNYLRKDNFELMPFSNIGQSYNTLSFDFQNNKTLPMFGARARHFNYMEIEDVNYYQVPTPLTELMYKTAFEQGQLLDAFFTTNISKQFNFSIAYKGLRSLGKYQHILTSTGNFKFTTNYTTKNNRYQARAHIFMQDVLNQENGGLTDEGVQNFASGEEEFLDRSVFDPNFVDAENILRGKRFHLEHKYNLIQKQDSTHANFVSIGNVVSLEDKYYQFNQTTSTDFFGESFRTSGLQDRVTLENFYNRFFLNYKNDVVGDVTFNVDYSNYNYGYNSLVVLNDHTIINRLKGSIVNLGGIYKNKIGKFDVQGELGINISGDFEGNFLTAQASYKLTDDIDVQGTFNTSSRAPDYNWLLYQSDYISYNWDNKENYDNISSQQLAFDLKSGKLANISFDYSTITNLTYFSKNELGDIKPFQSSATINYLRLKANKEIRYGKFALDNTIMYQQVLNGDNIINVPQIITRNTLYFSDHLFKRAMFLQTGVIFNYFTKYNMNGYDPLLAEFYVQNDTELGGFPRLDFFIDAKIRQTRIFLKAEHFNSSFTGYNYYSAPNYPYRDFTVRFGVVWNFFL
ncbi:MAG: putative porin [Aquaticitalea sp.]